MVGHLVHQAAGGAHYLRRIDAALARYYITRIPCGVGRRLAKKTWIRDGLAGILAAVKNSERDRVAMRAALERIQGVIADALA